MKLRKLIPIIFGLVLITFIFSACKDNDMETTYKVTFDKQGGNGGTSYVMASIDEDMPTAKAPSKSGYVFNGYYSEVEGVGIQYYNPQMKSTHKWNITNDSTLFAYWIKEKSSEKDNDTYIITLDSQGGTGGSSSVKAVYNQPMPNASMPTRVDYTFGGYFTEPNGKGTAYYASNMASLRSWDKQSDGTLYAYWISNYKEIIMNTNNYSQYFDIERSCQGAGVGYSNYFPVYVTYKITLKYEITCGEDTSILFKFKDDTAITYVNFTYINTIFGTVSATSSKVYLMQSAITKEAKPIDVSGKLYIMK